MIFAYRYGCYIFKHNICGDRPEVLERLLDSADLLPLEFFMNLVCSPVQASSEATTTEVPLNDAAKGPMEIAIAKDHGIL